MQASDFDYTLPDWDMPQTLPIHLPWDAYLAWLEENRRELIRTGVLEKILADPNRCPVNVRFTFD